jgi:manganese-dependent inorganic pyrophosphatase
LELFGLEPPRLLAGVAATFGHAAEAVAVLPAAAPLGQALPLLGEGAGAVPVVGPDGAPLGAITAGALARALGGAPSPGQALEAPCGGAAEAIPALGASERISDHRARLLQGSADEFLVLDSDGRCRGMARRSRILSPPRARLLLVDHNELSQAVHGAEEAEIMGVLDHHRLGNPPTGSPIPFRVEPVGSTSTLVYEAAEAGGAVLPEPVAGLLLAGLLSDTLILRSPTSTPRDQAAALHLARLAHVSIPEFGADLLRAGAGLEGRPAAEVIKGDRKRYRLGNCEVSVAQVETAGFQELSQELPLLLEGLEAVRAREGLALACLMVTDIVTGTSRMPAAGEHRILAALPFPRLAPGEFDLGGMVSRKKQLLPALQSVLELFS